MLFERLSVEHQDMIERYVDAYAGDSMRAELEYVLRFWDQNKSIRLAKMFGDQFILSKRVEFKKSADQLCEDMEHTLNCSWSDKYDEEASKFLRQIRSTVCDYVRMKDGDRYSSNYYLAENIFDYYHLALNRYTDERTLEITLPDGKVMKVGKGYKVTKAIDRLAKAFEIDGFEHFRIIHSQVLNQKKLTGTLCLSIHPMDYMTMSDNDCGWESCMSWINDGCYRQGTVEMMNSENVVVAYLAADNEMMVPGGYRWNSKKWRQLFIVSPEMIGNVKAYPYSNDALTEEVLSWLAELATNAGIGEYSESINYQPWEELSYNDKVYEIDPCTGYMYNDFSSSREDQFIRIGKAMDAASREYCGRYRFTIDYSGPDECMICGRSGNDFEGSEGSLGCWDCIPSYCCDACGDHHDRDELWELDGYFYCEYCCDEYCTTDAITEEAHHCDNCVEIYIGTKNGLGYTDVSFWVYDEGRKALIEKIKPYGELCCDKEGKWGGTIFHIPYDKINRDNDVFLSLFEYSYGGFHGWEDFDKTIGQYDEDSMMRQFYDRKDA